MAENNPNQTKRDALFLLDALKHVQTKVIFNVGEIALHRDVKVNSLETRFSSIRSRHKLNVGTTTDGFNKQTKKTTPAKKLTTAAAKPQLNATEDGSRPNRTPKPSAKKRQAEDDDGEWEDSLCEGDGESITTSTTATGPRSNKRPLYDGMAGTGGSVDDGAAWQQESYDGYYIA